jgi:hypothetical protein
VAITFFGEASSVSDNGTAAGPTATITPPASMLGGDLAVVWVQGRIANDNASYFLPNPANAGGQSWNIERWADGANVSGVFMWCQFNGTWSSNPTFSIWTTSGLSFNGSSPLTAVMLVFRPSSQSKLWVINMGATFASYTAPATPFTVTITGQTPTRASNVTIGAFGSEDVNTWGTLSGTNWSRTSLTAQWRNTNGLGMSCSFAYQIQTVAAATNNVSLNQATNGGDAGVTSIATFAEVDMPTTSNKGAVSPNRVQSSRTANAVSQQTLATSFSSTVTSGNAVIGMTHCETAANVGTPVITDDKGNTYIIIASVADNQFDQQMWLFWLPNVTNGPITVTADYNTATSFIKTVALHEVAGVSDFDKMMTLVHMQADVGQESLDMPNITPSVNGAYLFGAAEEPGFTNVDNLDVPVSPWVIVTQDDATVTSNTYEIVQGASTSAGLDLTIPHGQNIILAMAVFKPVILLSIPRVFHKSFTK